MSKMVPTHKPPPAPTRQGGSWLPGVKPQSGCPVTSLMAALLFEEWLERRHGILTFRLISTSGEDSPDIDVSVDTCFGFSRYTRVSPSHGPLGRHGEAYRAEYRHVLVEIRGEGKANCHLLLQSINAGDGGYGAHMGEVILLIPSWPPWKIPWAYHCRYGCADGEQYVASLKELSAQFMGPD